MLEHEAVRYFFAHQEIQLVRRKVQKLVVECQVSVHRPQLGLEKIVKSSDKLE